MEVADSSTASVPQHKLNVEDLNVEILPCIYEIIKGVEKDHHDNTVKLRESQDCSKKVVELQKRLELSCAQTFIDTYSKVARCKLSTSKTPIMAANLLNDQGSEFCARADQHDYQPDQLNLAIDDIDQTKTKAMSLLNWQAPLVQFFSQEAVAQVQAERKAGVTIYPPADAVFKAFELTPLDKIKVVILGQDPYHGPDQANGLCFSVPTKQTGLPPSLVNIYKELAADPDIPGFQTPSHGCLHHWASQGVLLLNTVLTVKAGIPNSHADCGWKYFTDKIIEVINHYRKGVVFLLWGKKAQEKGESINRERHLVLTATHPCPLSAHGGSHAQKKEAMIDGQRHEVLTAEHPVPFVNCRHFSIANQYLLKQGVSPIDWCLPLTVDDS